MNLFFSLPNLKPSLSLYLVTIHNIPNNHHQITKKQTKTGFFSLYRGLAPTLLGSIPKAGIRFGLNAAIKDNLRDKDGKLTAGKNFVAGLGAGVAEALMIVAPVETVKTKCIDLNMPFVDGMKHILKNEGIGGVYQGAFATALKQGSNQGLRFMWFNEYKTYMTNDGETELTPLLRLFGGMSAGCFSTLGNNPFDVVKVSQSFFLLEKGRDKEGYYE